MNDEMARSQIPGDLIWKTYPFDEKKTNFWSISNWDLWLKKSKDEWWLAKEPVSGRPSHFFGFQQLETFPDKAEVSHFHRIVEKTRPNFEGIALYPSCPDRSLVTRPEMPIEVLPGATAELYCGIPTWLDFSLVHGGGLIPVFLHAVKPLSRTWFGTPQQGEPCYGNLTRATNDWTTLRPNPFRIICPLKIRNWDTETLLLERICIRVRHLSIFRGPDALWSNEILITKRPGKEISTVIYQKSPPALEGEVALVCEPREAPGSSLLIMRTFRSLRGFVNSGL